jgi:hypothetical protein
MKFNHSFRTPPPPGKMGAPCSLKQALIKISFDTYSDPYRYVGVTKIKICISDTLASVFDKFCAVARRFHIGFGTTQIGFETNEIQLNFLSDEARLWLQ